MDRTKFDYHTYTAQKNILHECAKGSKPVEGFAMSARMEALVPRLAKQHPNWTIVSRGPYLNPGRAAASFSVYEAGESIGSIVLMYRGNSTVYGLTCARIMRETTRDNYKKTGDAVKAMRIANQYFVRKGISEIIDDIRSRTWQIGRDNKNLASGAYSVVLRVVFDPAIQYAKDNFEDFLNSPALKAHGVKPDDVRGLPQLAEALRESDELHHSTGYLVYIDSGVYTLQYVTANVENSGERNTLTQCPSALRGKLGSLKLMDAGAAVYGLGVRVSTNAFFIVSDRLTEEDLHG